MPRRKPEPWQNWRSGVQLFFLLLNVWIGVQFFLWVRYWEAGGQAWWVPRPPGVEGWLPIASLMNLKRFLLTGEMPDIHPAGVWLIGLFLLLSLVLPKSFCSWICPVGLVSEALAEFGRILFGRNFRLPRWLDVPLRSLKYLLLGLFLYAIGSMSVAAIAGFLDGPYGIVADVKMLDFFRRPSLTTVVVVLALVVVSILTQHFWCRYLCPYGALIGLVGLLSPVRVRRDPETCIDCGRCSRACPSFLDPAHKKRVWSPECSSCARCVGSCPVEGALELGGPRGLRWRPAWVAGLILGLFLGVYVAARWTGTWETHLPDAVYGELVPRAEQFSHP
ncbi:MAG: 4Fe-4S binding protein [Acidobacteriota bacterium]